MSARVYKSQGPVLINGVPFPGVQSPGMNFWDRLKAQKAQRENAEKLTRIERQNFYRLLRLLPEEEQTAALAIWNIGGAREAFEFVKSSSMGLDAPTTATW